MSRAAALACLVAIAGLAPLQAEAARFRLRSSAVPSSAARVMIVPIVSGGSQARAATPAAQPSVERRTPPATQAEAAPPPLRLGANDTKPGWCRSEVVIGGFCMMN